MIPSSKIIHFFVPRTAQSLQPGEHGQFGRARCTDNAPTTQAARVPILAASSVAEGRAGRTGDFRVLQTACKQEAVEVIIV